MTSVKNQALLASENELVCALEASALRQDVIHISAEINRTLGQFEAGVPLTESDFADMDSYIADTAEHLDYMDQSLLIDNLSDGADRIENISSSVNESSNAISMSATAATEIVSEIQGINEAMDKNNDVTNQLNTSTQKFEIV